MQKYLDLAGTFNKHGLKQWHALHGCAGLLHVLTCLHSTCNVYMASTVM